MKNRVPLKGLDACLGWWEPTVEAQMKVLTDQERDTVIAHLEHGLLEIVYAREEKDGVIYATIRPVVEKAEPKC